jgi:hypothetical protein
MRLRLSMIAILIAACIGIPKAGAEPLVTISCDKPDGFNIGYGTTLIKRFEASQKKQLEPPPALSGPNKDGIAATPTFVIDSNKEKMTVVWAELPKDAELRKRAKEMNIPQLPPPSASDATVVLFSRDQISAIEAEPWSITTYSFFPTLGTAFIGQQAMQAGSKNTMQLATFAHCEFSWTNPNDDLGKER